MRRLRQGTRTHDVYWWLDTFLKAAHEEDADLLPPVLEEHDLMTILPPTRVKPSNPAPVKSSP